MSEKRNTVIKSAKKSSPQIVNYFKCTFPAKSINESYARTVVSAFVSQLDPTVSDMADLKTAVSEAVTNAIVHGYKDSPKDSVVYLSGFYKTDGTVSVEIKDKGCGIENIKQAMEPLFTTLGGERAGLGFAVMESCADKVKVSSKKNKGTTVNLTFKIETKEVL